MNVTILITILFWGGVPDKTIEIHTNSEICSQELVKSYTQPLKEVLGEWKAIKSECVEPDSL